MKVIRALLARVRAVFRRDAIADEIREELDFHLAARTEEYERDGLAADEARRRARRRVGNVALLRDRGYDIRGGGVIETVLQDVRYGIRLLGRQRGFSFLAITTLALGIGASTAVVSVIDAAILRPLPYPDPEQLVEIEVEEDNGPGERITPLPSTADLRLWAEASQSFTHLAFRSSASWTIVDGAEPERLTAAEITEGYLEMHEVAPLRGRSLTADDMRPGAPLAILISEGYWLRRFGGRDDVVGQTVRYDDQVATIVGVVPRTFYPNTPIWRSRVVRADFDTMRGMGGRLYGRLRDGVGANEAAAELTRLTLSVDWGAGRGNPRVLVTSLRDRTAARSAETGTVLAGAVLSVLLLACINVAGLLVARGATRQPELAVRTAIGAGRFRLARQLLTESLVLAVAGGSAGVAGAWLVLDALVPNIPMTLPANSEATLNPSVLAFAAALSLGTGLVFGVLPAVRLTRQRADRAMANADRRSAASLPRKSGQFLIATEVALAVVLVAGAGLMLRSLDRILAVDLGFDPSAIVTMPVSLVDADAATSDQYYRALINAIRALPGVEAAGAGDQVPLLGASTFMSARAPGGDSVPVNIRRVLPGYFDAIGLPVIAGRGFTESEAAGSALVSVVVSEAAARQLYPDSLALGRRLTFMRQELEIVGVVGNLRHWGPLREADVEMYVPYGPAQSLSLPDWGMTIVIRATESATVTAHQLRQTALSIGPRVIVEDVRSGRESYGDTITTPRQRTVLLALLGALGLLLALVGIFGMTAYAVARRTREIGVRMAFGARPGHVVRRMVADAAWPIAIGTVLGLGTAALTTRVIESFLFETTPTDPVTFATAAVALATTGLIAAWLPARRAARVDPVAALRAEG
jgi:predicted permease